MRRSREPAGRLSEAEVVNLPGAPQLTKEGGNLLPAQGGQHLLKFLEPGAMAGAGVKVFQEEFLVGLTVQAFEPGVGARRPKCA